MRETTPTAPRKAGFRLVSALNLQLAWRNPARCFGNQKKRLRHPIARSLLGIRAAFNSPRRMGKLGAKSPIPLPVWDETQIKARSALPGLYYQGTFAWARSIAASKSPLVREPPNPTPTPAIHTYTAPRPGFPFGFLGAGGRLPKARRGRVFVARYYYYYTYTAPAAFFYCAILLLHSTGLQPNTWARPS